jgi:hypothetical protein
MCPFCIANAAMLAAGMTSMGGLTAFVAKKFSRRPRAKKNHQRLATMTTEYASRAAHPVAQGKALRHLLRLPW